MDKKILFKEFAKKHPSLNEYVANGSMTWQKFYEMYDIYGENSDIWQKYFKSNDRSFDFNKIKDVINNMDVDNISKHLDSAKKTLGFITSLAENKVTEASNNIPKPKPNKPNDITNFYGD